MASLKEVKGRINSINGTLKITSAMKMVASSKLHKAQEAIENMLPYERRLYHMLTNFLKSDVSVESPFIVKREVKKVAIVVFASNSSLCGGFNANVIRLLHSWLKEHEALGQEHIKIIPVGRKVTEAVRKAGFEVSADFTHLADKPSYDEAAALADSLMDQYLKGEVDRVELIYHHFRSTASQTLENEVFLPLTAHAEAENEQNLDEEIPDYIVEPSVPELVRQLLPSVLRTKIYTVVLDSNASEHAARTMAMQIATDNANDLIQDLTIMYNKSRQQVITNELLDIMGGSMA